MLLLETDNVKATGMKNITIAMFVIFLIKGSLSALLTMHVYVKPSKTERRGLNIFGFPRGTSKALSDANRP